MQPVRMILAVCAFGAAQFFCGSALRPVHAAENQFDELPPANQAAIDKATRYMLKAQNRDGSWGLDPGAEGDISCTCLGGMVLLSAGITEREGPPDQVRALRTATEYVLKAARRAQGDIATGQSTLIQGKLGQRVHNFFAITFLTQIYGMRQSEGRLEEAEELRQIIGKLTEITARTQEADGSWHKDTFGSLKATGMAWMALRSAASTGVPIRNAAVEKTVKFVKSQYNPSLKVFDGGGRMSGYQAIYATATCVRVLIGQGEGEEQRTRDAIDSYIQKTSKGEWAQMFLSVEGEDYLSAMMMTYALIDNDKERYERWFGFVGPALVKRQNADGSWVTTACIRGRVFPTACALLVLQAPYRYLPLQQ